MEKYIRKLKQIVERKFTGDIGTPSSINRLIGEINKATGQNLSMSTLKRLWCKVSDITTPSATTLDILARYAGYDGWRTFCQAMDGENSSDFIGTRVIRTKDMNVGDTVRLRWHPDRTCSLCYLGNGRYEVTDQQNSKLCVGATFHTDIIAHGQPLFANSLVMNGIDKPISYIAGKTRGVEILQ